MYVFDSSKPFIYILFLIFKIIIMLCQYWLAKTAKGLSSVAEPR